MRHQLTLVAGLLLGAVLLVSPLACSRFGEEVSAAPDAAPADAGADVALAEAAPGTFCASQRDREHCADFEQGLLEGWEPTALELTELGEDTAAAHGKIAVVTIPAGFARGRGNGLRKLIGEHPASVTVEFDLRVDEASPEQVQIMALKTPSPKVPELQLLISLTGKQVRLAQFDGSSFDSDVIADVVTAEWTHVTLVAKYGPPNLVSAAVGSKTLPEMPTRFQSDTMQAGQLVLVHGLNFVDGSKTPLSGRIRYAIDNVTLEWK